MKVFRNRQSNNIVTVKVHLLDVSVSSLCATVHLLDACLFIMCNSPSSWANSGSNTKNLFIVVLQVSVYMHLECLQSMKTDDLKTIFTVGNKNKSHDASSRLLG
jgi:hypothetical protein